MHLSRRFTLASLAVMVLSSTTPIGGRSTSAFAIASAWPRRRSNRRLAAGGDSYDNALAETINGLYKAELIHRRTAWKTRESVELATLEWVAWFNHHRLMEPLGYIPPTEAEASYYRQLQMPATEPLLT
ncbi:hypothetical protein LMG32289_06730 [Cupriavidus pampae]|uniref:Integrase catalytic domain-containing protein n=1 Tax=Cupriavidus pampae TaxID=659251 RepID=A0ABM8Y2P5_9BURK|nr:hypothetical protein LMG32289_06730 [Cupriavidus pampae]